MPKVKIGKPLPSAKVLPVPTQKEIDLVVTMWNSNCPLFFVGLLEAQGAQGNSRFIYDRAKLQYSIRKTGRVVSRREISAAFIEFNNRMAKK